MSGSSGFSLLHEVAVRILGDRVRSLGRSDVVTGVAAAQTGRMVDIASVQGPAAVRIKVKSDPYIGDDATSISDRDLPFYRGVSDTMALEAVADAATRSEGWALASQADQLWYYRIALSAPEDEVRALLAEPDAVFYAELPVAADDLAELDMRALRSWFEENMGAYPSRPVAVGGTSSWQRLVPRQMLLDTLPGVHVIGPVFAEIAATR